MRKIPAGWQEQQCQQWQGGLFGGGGSAAPTPPPPAPNPPPPPPAPPTTDTAGDNAQADVNNKLRIGAAGQQSTLLTGGLGDTSTPTTTNSNKVLLGQ